MGLKIINCGNGVHQREVTGISLLSALPPNWYAYTNLDLANAPGTSREIDVIIVAEDRILVVDLKDWKGPIESRDGHWFNGKRDNGPSPVAKISQNARDIYIQLKSHLQRYSKGGKVIVPKVQGLVVLTQVTDLSGIAETEVLNVMPIAAFTSILKSVPKRIETFGAAPPQGDLTSTEWKDQLSKFFNVTKGVFFPGRRTYGGFYATSPEAVFQHPNGIYSEFEASDERQSPTLGVLRLWDFTKAEARFQSAEGRSEIAGREQEVIAYLQDRCDSCDSVIVDGRTRDPNFGPGYWEVFDRRRRLHRLMDFSGTELVDLTRGDRIELARQLLTSLDALHLAEACHLDLGQHSIWLQRPSTVRLSHLMAASYPDVRSLGSSRYQFLATGRLPEDEFGDEGTAKQRDVFLASTAVHRILFGTGPGSPNGCPEWSADADPALEYAELHEWFAKALAWEPAARFQNAGAALTAFNAATAVRPTPAEVLEGLDRYRGSIKTQFQLYAAYPPTEVLRDDETRMLWRSRSTDRDVLVKIWKRASWGDQQREGARILDFLDRLSELGMAEPAGCARILETIWLGDAIVMIQEWIDSPNLERLLADGSTPFEENHRLTFVAALAELVEELHTQGLTHGDLKPTNVLVDPSAPEKPVVVDLVDFVAASDGETVTSHYAPEVGDRYERDCYAVTVIADELLAGVEGEIPDRIRSSIARIRSDEPVNATLLPLIDAIRFVEPDADTSETIRLLTPHAAEGPLLADEGAFYLRRAQWRRALVIRGAVEELEIELTLDGKPYRIERRSIDQSRIRPVLKFEFGRFKGRIVIEQASVTDLSAMIPILEREDVAGVLAPAEVRKPSQVSTEQYDGQDAADVADGADLRERVPAEPPEDDFIEAIVAGPAPSGNVDVAGLWQALVDAERELVTYGQAAEDSVFDPVSGKHRVHFDLLAGSFDYNRRDWVNVEREDRHHNWRPLAQLDLQKSTPSTLILDGFRPGSRSGPPLIREGDELRFSSHMEETSLDRRQTAVKRIVERSSRTRNLISIFDPASRAAPKLQFEKIPAAELKETYDLNDRQAEVLSTVLATRPVALVQGPPGTGKTVFIAALVHAALTRGLARNVLLASQAHEAVNNAAEAVLKLFAKAGEVPSILRVGNEGVVSDRLLPFHVERVEQLQKDRFRAEMRERLAIAARGLGIEPDMGERLALIELAVRPVAARLAELEGDEAAAQRATALRETIAQQIAPIGVAAVIAMEAPAEQMTDHVVTACLAGVPHEARPSADRVARFQSIAALARDFVGTVSTEQRSLETFLAGTRQIVAGSCVGLGRSALGLTSMPFDLVIVDEAARCTASELAVPIQAGTSIVLVGDQNQLEPQHPEQVVDEVAERLDVGVAEVARSDFERVFETDYGCVAGHSLRRQYRMLQPIGEIVSQAFYDGALEHGREKLIVDLERLPAELATPVAWVDTAPLGERARQGEPNHRKSIPNAVEADAIIALLKRWSESDGFLSWLTEHTAHTHAIGIICGYSAQRDLVKRKINLASIHPALRAALKVDTIDSYQGKENPIVIVSLVRNNWDGPKQGGVASIRPGFLAKPNRINVAISRAMDRLVIVGSRERWLKGSPMDRIAQAFADNVKAGHAAVVEAGDLLDGIPAAPGDRGSAEDELEFAR